MERVGGAAGTALGQIPGAGGTGTDKAAGRKKREPRGRQERDGQEKVIVMKEFTDRLPHLIASYNSSKDAAKQFNDDVKAVAKKSGLLASVVRKGVVAKAGDDFDDKAKEVEQLELVFEKLGK